MTLKKTSKSFMFQDFQSFLFWSEHSMIPLFLKTQRKGSYRTSSSISIHSSLSKLFYKPFCKTNENRSNLKLWTFPYYFNHSLLFQSGGEKAHSQSLWNLWVRESKLIQGTPLFMANYLWHLTTWVDLLNSSPVIDSLIVSSWKWKKGKCKQLKWSLIQVRLSLSSYCFH